CLLNHLEVLGGSVIRPCELIGFTATASGVEAQVCTDGTTETIKTRWLIGCDGMHSAVRDQPGVAFAGGEYEQGFALADVHMDWPLSRDEVSLFFSPAGFVVVAPLPEEHFRIVATADHVPERPAVDFMQQVLDARGPAARPARIHDVLWSSRFHIHHRV